jgi:hypothetical protein
MRTSTALALVLFVIGMALWSRLNQCQVWQSLVGKLSDLHLSEPEDGLSDSGIQWATPGLGQSVRAGPHARAMSGARKHARCLLWSLSAQGH